MSSTFAASISVANSFDVIKFKIAHRDLTGKIKLYCFHKQEMIKQGRLTFVCGQQQRCQLEIDQSALIFFGDNDYIQWTENEDGTADWILDIPRCKQCCGNPAVLDAGIQLSSFLGPKTVSFPSHKCALWRCRGGPICKKGKIHNVGSASQDPAYNLLGGWKKFQPEGANAMVYSPSGEVQAMAAFDMSQL